jgi:hypothetical protein
MNLHTPLAISRARRLQIISGAIALIVIAGIGLLASSLPPPSGPLIAAVFGLLSYRLADKALDFVFGADSEGLPRAIDPMLRVRYQDEMRKRIQSGLMSPQTKEDFFNFPNAKAFVQTLSLVERKEVPRVKAHGRLEVSRDALYIEDDFKARAAEPRVEHFVEYAVDMMTLPPEADRWASPQPQVAPPEPMPNFGPLSSDARSAILRGSYASIIIHIVAFEHWVGEWKKLNPKPVSRDEYYKKNPLDELPFKESTEAYLRRSDQREEHYYNTFALYAMGRDYQLAADKLKGYVVPAFEAAFPNQLQTVMDSATRYIHDTSELMSESGWYYADAHMKMLGELGLVRKAINNLESLFKDDPSIKPFAVALGKEIDFLLEQLAATADPKKRGLVP